MLMPWWMQAYTILFIVMVISNIFFQIRTKARKYIIIYDFFSAGYMAFLIFAYWTPSIIDNIDFWNLSALPFIICIDFYLTIWGEEENLGIKITDMSKKEFELAKAVSIILTSPAYITGILLMGHVIMTNK